MEKKIEKNMLRNRADKADAITDEMWLQVRNEHRDLVAEYLSVSTHLSKNTLKQYESGLRHFFWWVHEILNDKPLEKISKRDFMRYMSYMQNRGLSSSGINFKRSAVSSFNTYIENIVSDDDRETYGMFRNFTRGIPPTPKNQVYSKEPITYEEYRLLIDTLVEDENYLGVAWVATAFNVGARRAEIPQLKTEILNYQIPDDANYVLSHTVIGKGQAGGKPLEFMVNREALKYMQLWIDKRGYEHEYIFTTRYGGKIDVISDSWANYFCSDVLSDIIGRRVNPHIFKASAITYLLDNGVPMHLVSKYVAHHESIETTSQHYDLRDFEEERGEIFKHIDL